jgi:hypothetical protein
MPQMRQRQARAAVGRLLRYNLKEKLAEAGDSLRFDLADEAPVGFERIEAGPPFGG